MKIKVPEWIKGRDINGNYGYINTKTRAFRSTIPNSVLEKLQDLRKRNKAVANELARRTEKLSWLNNRRNHSDETIKKYNTVSNLTADKNGGLLVIYY